MAFVSSNINGRYQPLKDTARPTFFEGNDASLALSRISQNTHPHMNIRSLKRSRSALSNHQTAFGESEIGYDDGCGTPERVTKIPRDDREGDGNIRRTRSMAVSAN